MSRLIIVSNRLPITVKRTADGIAIEPSAGGLATGLSKPHADGDGLWIGWPGSITQLDAAQRGEVERELAERRLVPVHLDDEEVRRYYEGFSNGLLWPLFHYLLDQVPLRVDDWDAYVAANRRFADAVVAAARPGDVIWVHDYQLLLVPGMLRERLPDTRIGFFLHIPFPAAAVLRALPHREEILRGLLGADLVGFHTPNYARHFSGALLRMLGLETRVDRVSFEDRDVRIASFPMGVDAREFARLGDDPEVRRRADDIRGKDGVHVLLGIDRLDYTKGLQRRLLAYEELLRANPELHGKVRLVQVAVPSRQGVKAYREFRTQVDALVGRIQGQFATATWSPLQYLHRSLRRRGRGAVPRGGRDARDADPRRHEPRREGVRRDAHRRRRRARLERVRRRGARARGIVARQSVRRAGDGADLQAGTRAVARRSPRAHAATARARAACRRPHVGRALRPKS